MDRQRYRNTVRDVKKLMFKKQLDKTTLKLIRIMSAKGFTSAEIIHFLTEGVYSK